jgi:uncharacterized membrane protein YfcA
MVYRPFTALLVVLAFATTPALAVPVNGGTPVDEPGALSLLALGVVGLVVGRQVAKRRD